MQKKFWWIFVTVVVLALAVSVLGGRDEPPGTIPNNTELFHTSEELSRQVGAEVGEIRREVRDARSDCTEIRRLCGEIERIALEGIESSS